MINQIYLFRLLRLVFFLLPIISISQKKEIHLKNPSFEDAPRLGIIYDSKFSIKNNKIKGWFDCGTLDFEGSSAPDIHSKETNYWHVNNSPSEGNTYMGLVVRNNDSWEGVSQKLKKTLKKNKCYSFTIDLCKSIHYKSGIPGGVDTSYLFNESAVLTIWGGKGKCGESEILYESPPVNNEKWLTYEINIQPTDDIKYITLQAYYIEDSEPYNGNVLVDNISPIAIVSCKD